MFRDDNEKRDFVMGGVAAGISAAFQAPLGGLLFTIEQVASSWRLQLVYRTLVTSVVGVYVTGSIQSLLIGEKLKSTHTGVFNFGEVGDFEFIYFEMGIFALMGVAGGLMGSFFIFLSCKCARFRENYLNSKILKVAEAMIVCGVTVTIAAITIYSDKDCRSHALDKIPYPVRVSMFLSYSLLVYWKSLTILFSYHDRSPLVN